MPLTQEELTTEVTQELKGLATHFEDEDYTNAVADALRETGWSFPLSTAFQDLWTKRRVKRHLFYMLYTESAHKFKVKQLNLQHRFEHYGKIIAFEDEQFEKAQQENAYEFAGVSAIHMFGSTINAGFAYDSIGRDLTYQKTNKVIVTPSSVDDDMDDD